MTFNSTCIGRAGKVSAYGVEQTLHSFVFERRTADHGHDFHRQSGLAQSATDLILSDSGWIVEIFLHESIIEFSDLLQHFVTPFLGFCLKVCGNLFH